MMQTKLNPRTEEMRKQIAGAYPGYTWKNKVKYMKENQVQAIWHRMVRDGQIKY